MATIIHLVWRAIQTMTFSARVALLAAVSILELIGEAWRIKIAPEQPMALMPHQLMASLPQEPDVQQPGIHYHPSIPSVVVFTAASLVLGAKAISSGTSIQEVCSLHITAATNTHPANKSK